MLQEELRSHHAPPRFLDAVARSFAMYKEHGARSTEKLKPLHQYVAEVLRAIWGNPFRVCCMGENGGERTVRGKYYPKDIDITVTRDNEPVFCLGIKFVTSNYKQNANNYFENMMGETANIQAAGGLPYVHLIILRRETPYYEKDGTIKKTEIIGDKDIQKYAKLILDNSQAHRPRFIAIPVIELDDSTGEASMTDLDASFSPQVARMLKGALSLRQFFADIRNHSELVKAGLPWEA